MIVSQEEDLRASHMFYLITEKSLANIDVVVIPNNIQTVIPGKHDLIYFRETVILIRYSKKSSIKTRILLCRNIGHRNLAGYD